MDEFQQTEGLPKVTRWLWGDLAHLGVSILAALGIAAALSAQFLFHHPTAVTLILIIAIAMAGIPLSIDLFRELFKGNLTVDILAATSIITSLILQQYWVAIIVILMLSGGKSLEEFATRRASSVLAALAKRMPQVAHRLQPDGSATDTAISAVAVGDLLLIYPHEICPVDGSVLSGAGGMDESYLTGEPFLIEKAPGSLVLSGAMNGDAALTIRAERLAKDSRYAKIVEVLHASQAKRPHIRRLGDRLGSWYTPAALLLALTSWYLSGQSERFLAVLVIATPCPLLIAIPVAIIGAISVAAHRGMVIKDSSILEKLDSCKTLIVDKTGTLTHGRPVVNEVLRLGQWSSDYCLQLAASLERYSKHPLAAAIMEAAGQAELLLLNAHDVSESPGTGLKGHIDGHALTLTGRGKLAPAFQTLLPAPAAGLECILLIDEELAGIFRLQDQPRHESKHFLRHLGSRHQIDEIILLSGDRPAEVSLFASGMGISHFYGGKSPEEKVEIVRKITAKKPTLYLGDGINDAPAMLNATVGIALGVNSDITSEAAGAVILQSSLTSVDELIHIGRRMRYIALSSAVGGMALSLVGMAAAAAGYLSPLRGALLQEIIDLLSILNSLRMILPVESLSDFHAPPLNVGKDVAQRIVGVQDKV